MSDPRILLYDIETVPNLAWVWGRYQQDVIETYQDWYMVSVAWKWLGERTVHVAGLDEFGFDSDDPDDSPLCEVIHELFTEADIVVAHNGNKFDQPKAQARMLVHGMDPPEPYREIDTLKVAKRYFKFDSNRLKDLAVILNLPHKADAGGYDTWKGCMAGDPKAWAAMKAYNKQDVVVLEALYLRLRPWIDNHPNVALIADRPKACPKCGVEGQMEGRGMRSYAVTQRRRYQCKACRGWCQGRQVYRRETEYA